MNFTVWKLSDDSAQILLVAASSKGVCVASVACDDIREVFEVQASCDLLLNRAKIRESNRETLSDIANSLFEAGQDRLMEVFHVAHIRRNHLAARRREFAWSEYDIPEAMEIPEASKVAFSKFEQEQDIVARMLRSLVSLSDPNAGEKADTGVDVLVELVDRRVAFQVKQYHSDAGTGGSSLRGEESRKASEGLSAAMSIKPCSMRALIDLVQAAAKKGWSQKDFPDVRLLIAASIPQVGGRGSTFLFDPCLRVDELNAQLSPILEQTRYAGAYLYIMMPEAVYEWTRKNGWGKLR
jgi:hypothetical protein